MDLPRHSHAKLKTMTKNELRRRHLERRHQMLPEDVQNKSYQIVKGLMDQKWFVDVDIIFAYNAFNKEVSLADLSSGGKAIALPQVIDRLTMVFRLVDETSEFKKSAYGVLEPIDGTVVEPTERSLILVPASCYDLQGNRIGYGGGYYDRYLSNHGFTGKRVGVCYDHQVTGSIPAEAHDVRVDAIMTESRYIEIN